MLTGPIRSANAQSQPSNGGYVSVSALTDVKRFSGDPSTNVLDGAAFGGAVAVGSTLGARWDVEVGFDASRFTENVQSTSVTVRRELITLQSHTRNRFLSVGALIRYRPAPHGRVQLGYLGGLSFVRLHRFFDTEGPDTAPSTLIPRPQDLIDYGASPTLGIDARIAIAKRLSLLAAMHVSSFAFRDVSGVLLRPRIGVRWQW